MPVSGRRGLACEGCTWIYTCGAYIVSLGSTLVYCIGVVEVIVRYGQAEEGEAIARTMATRVANKREGEIALRERLSHGIAAARWGSPFTL